MKFDGQYYRALIGTVLMIILIVLGSVLISFQERFSFLWFIGETPVSIKPMTYKTKNMLREQIEVKFIFYDKKKDGINVDISDLE